jgi:CheY-like chemotaxis protein
VKSHRILVVDDDDDIRLLVTMSLSRLGGHETRECSNGRDAVDVAAEWLPDAVLMDVRMPVMDGPTAASQLAARQQTAAIPVILMTASVRREEQRVLAGLQIAGVLAKPFDPMTLSGDIATMLGWT